MPRILLLGAGHAHIELCRRAAELADAGHEVTLVSPDGFWYSGLATGVLGGQYPAAADRVDAAALIRRNGGAFIAARAARIDAAARQVRLEDGRALSYDLLSCNIGSRVRPDALAGAGEHAVPVKPIERLVALGERLTRRLRGPGVPPRLVVVGGGASGCEVAANLRALAASAGSAAPITIVTRGELLPDFPRGARRSMRRFLARRGIAVRAGAGVRGVAARELELESGERLPFDALVDATGLAPPPLFRDSGLPVDAAGALRVDARLRCIGDARIFAVGDCAAFEPRPLARVGVYPVRQAPVLLENLSAAAAGAAPRAFEPQRRFLLILNLGDRTALAVRGRLYWRGRSMHVLKDRIDRRFLDRYRTDR